MSIWLKRFREALALGLAWAVAWAPLGVLVGMILDPDESLDEPWVALGAYPGLICGAIFFLAALGNHGYRRLNEMSLARAATWGAAIGLFVVALPATGALGAPNTEHPLWQWRLAIVGAVTLLSAISAVGSVLVARAVRSDSAGVV